MPIEIYQSPESQGALAFGAQRRYWWIAQPGVDATANTASDYYNRWYPVARGGEIGPTIQVSNGNGSTVVLGWAWSAADGRYFNYASGAGGFIGQLIRDSRIRIADVLNQPALTAAPEVCAVVVVRETMAFHPTAPGGGSALFGGGFVVGGVTMFGAGAIGTLFTGGYFRGIGLCYTGLAVRLLIMDSGANFTFVDLPAAYDPFTRAVIEHRLYAPTVSSMARYELYIGDVLAATVHADHASWPQIGGVNDFAMPCPFVRDAAASLSSGKKSWYHEIFAGPDVPELYAG